MTQSCLEIAQVLTALQRQGENHIHLKPNQNVAMLSRWWNHLGQSPDLIGGRTDV